MATQANAAASLGRLEEEEEEAKLTGAPDKARKAGRATDDERLSLGASLACRLGLAGHPQARHPEMESKRYADRRFVADEVLGA